MILRGMRFIVVVVSFGFLFSQLVLRAQNLDIAGISQVLEDDDGVIWLVGSNGLQSFDYHKPAYWDVGPFDAHTLSKDGRLWLANSQIMVHFNPNKSTIVQSFQHQMDRVFQLTFFDGTLWLAGENGIANLDTDGKLLKSWDKENLGKVNVLYPDEQGIWFGGEGLHFWNGSNLIKALPKEANHGILGMGRDRFGQLYLGGHSGFHVLNQNGQWNHLGQPFQGIPRDLIWDSSGRFWIVTEKGKLGVYYVGLNEYNTWPLSGDVQALFLDSKQDLWQITGSNIQKLPLSTVKPKWLDPLPTSLQGTQFWLHQETGQRFWIFGEQRVDTIDGITQHIKSIKTWPWKITSYFEDANGQTWLGNENGDLLHFLPETSEIKDTDTLFQDEAVVALAVDEKRLWAVSNSGQLVSVDRETSSQVTLKGSLVQPVRDMQFSRDGSLWGLDGQGLWRVSNLGQGLERLWQGAPESELFWDGQHPLWLSNSQVWQFQDDVAKSQMDLPPELQGAALVKVGPSSYHFVFKGHVLEIAKADGRLINYQTHVFGFDFSGSFERSGNTLYGIGEHSLTSFGLDVEPKSKPQLKLWKVYLGEDLYQAAEDHDLKVNGKKPLTLDFRVLPLSDGATASYEMRINGEAWMPLPSGTCTFPTLSASETRLEVRAFLHGLSLQSSWSGILKTSNPNETWIGALLCLALGLCFVWVFRYHLNKKRALATSSLPDHELSHLLARTVHEIGTPLNGMMGLVDATLERQGDKLEARTREDLKVVLSSGQRLKRLVNDLMEYTGGRGKRRAVLYREAVHLKSVGAMVIATCRDLRGSKPIGLRNEFSADLPAVNADEDRLYQILLNLVMNAIKFTHQGSVTLRGTLEDQSVLIEVVDTGIGIPESKRDAIFEPFYQIESNTTRDHEGHGLGLTIVRELVERHQSTIGVSANPEGGSIFSFSLPIEHATVAATRPIPILAEANLGQVQAMAGPITQSTSGPVILVVDDDAVNRKVLVNYLVLNNYRFIEAGSGLEALSILERETIDLVLLDVMMPGMSGFELCTRIRSKHTVEDLPVLFVTARVRDSDILRGFQAGANDYLSKPISRTVLLARLESQLKAREAHAAARRENQLLGREVEVERLARLSRESEIRMLQAQIHPHFMQNALNTAVFYCLKEPRTAIKALTQLSSLLRSSFNAGSRSWWPLQEEIHIIENYVAIEMLRFKDRLEFDWHLDDGIETWPIPCFMIQPLVENAVIHGVGNSYELTKVRLTCHKRDPGLFIEVCNQGEPLPCPFEELLSDDHALGNIQKRLKLSMNSALNHRYEDGWHHFSIELNDTRGMAHDKGKPEQV